MKSDIDEKFFFMAGMSGKGGLEIRPLSIDD
jgi:hypothetical protein